MILASVPEGRLFHAHGPVGLQSLHLSHDLLNFLFEELSSDVPTLMAEGFHSCASNHAQMDVDGSCRNILGHE